MLEKTRGGGRKQVDKQTGRKPAAFPVGVRSVLWTQLSDSAFRAGRPERGGQGDRQPEQHNKDAVRKRGREKTTDEGWKTGGMSFFPPGNKRGALSHFRCLRFGDKSVSEERQHLGAASSLPTSFHRPTVAPGVPRRPNGTQVGSSSLLLPWRAHFPAAPTHI